MSLENTFVKTKILNDLADAIGVYGENSEGVSPMPRDSAEMTVIDAEIRESENGDVPLLPFNLSVDMRSSKFGEIPSIRETSENHLLCASQNHDGIFIRLSSKSPSSLTWVPVLAPT